VTSLSAAAHTVMVLLGAQVSDCNSGITVMLQVSVQSLSKNRFASHNDVWSEIRTADSVQDLLSPQPYTVPTKHMKAIVNQPCWAGLPT
jgi:hypothetical protein